MAPTKTDDLTDRRLQLLVGLVVCAAAISVAAGLRVISTHSYPDTVWQRSAILCALIGIATHSTIRVRIRASEHGSSWTDSAVLIGMAVIPGEWLVVAVAPAVLASILMRRVSPLKTAFNVSKDVLIASVGVLVAAATGPLPVTAATLHHPAGILAVLSSLFPAALAVAALDWAITLPVIALATRTPIRQRMFANWDMRLLSTLLRFVVVLAAVLLVQRQSPALIVLPVLVLSLNLWYSNGIRTREERAAWARLSQATDEFNEVDMDTVLRQAVVRGAQLFSTDEVDIEVRLPGHEPRLVRGSSEGLTYDGPPELAPPVEGYTIPAALASHDGDTDIGRLHLHFRGRVRLKERERYCLHTYAAALCTAVRNAAAFADAERMSAEHEYAATHDPLTGLPNRRQLQSYGRELLEQAPRVGVTALVLIDLNHFKDVNDTLGHSAGDRVLIQVAHRLQATVREGDLVVRLGGDEFAVLLNGLPAPALAVPRARALVGALATPIELDGMRIGVEASAGIATAPAAGGVSELLRRADVAMYQAKRDGQGVAVYTRARDTADLGSLALGGDLRRALAEEQFTLRYQPIVDLASGIVLGAEALARWRHPEHGDLGPGRFLNAIERSAQLPAFAEGVLDQALVAAGRWREAGFAVPVAVNVSPRSVLDPSFPTLVTDRLDRHGLPAEALIVELTESLTLSQLEVVDEVLHALREAGVQLALDDFGTGYSSLATLARVPVHEIKIDRSFVNAMDDQAGSAVVRSTIDLGRSLGLMVVAEGVETEEQRSRLWELGCPAGQGHLFARPMPLERFIEALRRGCGDRPGAFAPTLHDSAAVIRMPTNRRGRGAHGSRLNQSS